MSTLAIHPCRAVIFDFFGTLTEAVQPGPAHGQIARLLGCDPELFAAELNRTFYQRAQGSYGSSAEALLRVARTLGARPSIWQIAGAVAIRVNAVRADIRLRAEAVPVLRWLHLRRIRTAVLSDCTHELPALVPGLPVGPLLDAQVYSIEVGACKPDPSIYLEACARLAVDPQECLYIGDGSSQELTGASRVGMRAIRLDAPDLVDHLYLNPEEEWAGRTARSLAEAVAALDRTPAGV